MSLFINMQKPITNMLKIMIKIENHHIFNIGMQKLSVNNFEWIEDTSQFNEDFIRNYNKESEEGYFL